jgi:hypothetical protein
MPAHVVSNDSMNMETINMRQSVLIVAVFMDTPTASLQPGSTSPDPPSGLVSIDKGVEKSTRPWPAAAVPTA